jgi:enoyl-CoA hydratase/carnithine racemase
MEWHQLSLERLHAERDGDIVRVFLNRPEARNAIDQRMLEELGDLFVAFETAFDVRLIVVAGRGPSFSAGADRREAAEPASTEREARYRQHLGRRAMRAIEDCSIPTLARVQGHAAGGGSCIAASCDFRLTTDDTQWWVPEVELGTPLPWAGVPRLIQEIGMARARRYVLLSERIPGTVAEDWGLAHESCADEAALDAAMQRWEARLLEMPEMAVALAKSHFRGYARASSLGDLSETDGELSTLARQTDDFTTRFRNF